MQLRHSAPIGKIGFINFPFPGCASLQHKHFFRCLHLPYRIVCPVLFSLKGFDFPDVPIPAGKPIQNIHDHFSVHICISMGFPHSKALS